METKINWNTTVLQGDVVKIFSSWFQYYLISLYNILCNKKWFCLYFLKLYSVESQVYTCKLNDRIKRKFLQNSCLRKCAIRFVWVFLSDPHKRISIITTCQVFLLCRSCISMLLRPLRSLVHYSFISLLKNAYVLRIGKQ